MMFPYNRLNEIFDYVRQDNIVSASQLSVLLNITDRTIRSDIQAIYLFTFSSQYTIKRLSR